MNALMLALSLLSPPASAGSLAGVTLPDAATVGGQQLVLNGMGLREKYMLDVYVAGLYLPAKTNDPAAAIHQDVNKRLVMELTLGVSREKLAASIQEAVVGRGLTGEAQAGIDQLAAWMEDVEDGDQVVLDYTPGVGTTMTIKGVVKGTVPGDATMRALWSIYLGDPPVTRDLRDGLLGR